MYPTATPPLVLNERVPDPAVKILHASFEKYKLPLASVERLSQGYSWAEGPVYFGDARCLLWSDIPNSRIMRWDEESGATSVYRKPSNYANGNTRDRQGRLVTAEHGRRVTRTEYDGRITVLMDRLRRQAAELAERHCGEVRRLDLVHRHERRPHRQLERRGRRAGTAAAGLPHRRQDRSGHDRHRRRGEAAERPCLLARRENPLCHRERARRRARSTHSTCATATKLTNRRKLIVCAKEETPDGFRVDVDGNLWCGWGMGTAELDGVRIFNPQGTPIGHISLPERAANVCFGGPKRNRLFMAACHSIYALYVNTQGALGG